MIRLWSTFVSRHPVSRLWLVLILYCVLLLPTVGRQGISWDEQTDIHIARSYLMQPGGWLRGSKSDPSQTRLPMALVAVVYALLNTEDLGTARLVSCGMGALTIIAVFILCRRDFDNKRGWLAGILLATSPFFLSFARTAFTETDIFVACAFVWLLVAMSYLQEHQTVGWAAVTGVILGLALSAKFTVVVVFPAIFFHIRSFSNGPSHKQLSTRDMCVGAALLTVMALVMTFGWLRLNAIALASREGGRLPFFVLALISWIAVLVWAAWRRNQTLPPMPVVGFVLGLALGTFMILPPVHLTNPQIIASLVGRFNNEVGWNPAFMGEAAALHIACVVFKSSPLVGIGLLAGVVGTALQWKTKRASRFLLLLVGFYFLGLVLLPLAQTFYMMPLLPVLAILAADQLLTLAERHKSLALFVGGAAVALLSFDLISCYPDFNLNGYQWLGARYVGGRSTIGYRSVGQTTSDGVQQAAQWLNEHAQPGDRVVAYVYPWHILEATCPNPSFRFIRGEWDSVYTMPDYVVVHINHRVRQRWAAYFTGWENNAPAESVFWEPYDADWLRANFSKVATVPRAFDIEMVSVWERN